MTRRSKTKRDAKVPTAPDVYNPDRARRPTTRTPPRSDLSRSTARFRPIAPASLPLSTAPFPAFPEVVVAGARSPHPAHPSVDQPRNSRFLLRDAGISLANSLLRRRGQRHVRAAAECSKPRVCGEDRTLLGLPGRCRDRTPSDTLSGRHRGGNDTVPERQRHAARGPTTTTCCRLPSYAIARLPSSSRCWRAPAAGEPVPGVQSGLPVEARDAGHVGHVVLLREERTDGSASPDVSGPGNDRVAELVCDLLGRGAESVGSMLIVGSVTRIGPR
jgi:hypothetical protein